MSFSITEQQYTIASSSLTGINTRSVNGVIIRAKRSAGSPSAYGAVLTNQGEILVYDNLGGFTYLITVTPLPIDFDISNDGYVITTDGTTLKLYDNTGVLKATRTQSASYVAVGTTYVWIQNGATYTCYTRSNLSGTAVVTWSSANGTIAINLVASANSYALVANNDGSQVAGITYYTYLSASYYHAYVYHDYGNTSGRISTIQIGSGTGSTSGCTVSGMFRRTFDLYITMDFWVVGASQPLSQPFNFVLVRNDGTTFGPSTTAEYEGEISDDTTTLSEVDGTYLKLYTLSGTYVATLQTTITPANSPRHVSITDDGQYVLIVDGTDVSVYSFATGLLVYNYVQTQSNAPSFLTRQV